MSTSIRAMRRVGTTGNYLRITPTNERLLLDRKMVEVVLVEDSEGKLVEEGAANVGDILGSKNLARLISDILTMDDRRARLVAHAASLSGGHAALKQAGIDIPNQTIHDSPATRSRENKDNQSKKVREARHQKNQTRAQQRQVGRDAAAERAKKAAALSKKPDQYNSLKDLSTPTDVSNHGPILPDPQITLPNSDEDI